VPNAIANRLLLARDLGGELDAFRPHALEEKRLRGALDQRAQGRQRCRLIMDFDFVMFDQPLHEPPQPEFFEIDFAWRR
jgi:hypothetical protein